MRFLIFILTLCISSGIIAQDISNGDLQDWATDTEGNLYAVGWENFGTLREDSTGNRYMDFACYPTCNTQWFRKREILNVVPGGISFRQLPTEFPPSPSGLSCYGWNYAIQYSCFIELGVMAYQSGDIVFESNIPYYDGYSCEDDKICFEIEFGGEPCDSILFWLGADVSSVLMAGAFDDFGFIESVGIQEYDKMPSLKLYPNPASEILNFSQEEIGEYFQVIDALGRPVIEGLATGSISVDELEDGLYILHLRSDSGKQKSQSFFIQR